MTSPPVAPARLGPNFRVHKCCTGCGEWLPLSDYSRRSPRDPRPVAECRKCRAIRTRVSRLKAQHDPLLELTEKQVGVYRGGTWRPRRQDAA